MPARYLHGTPRTDSTHSAGAAFTHPRMYVQRAVSSRPPCPPLPIFSAHALGPSVGHERERLASLRSRAIRDVTIKVTSLPEYPAQTERRKLDRNPSPFQPQRSPYPPSSAFLSHRGVSMETENQKLRKRSNDAIANESKRVSEQDTTRKDGTKNDGTVGGFGEGNFVDATFPVGERCSLTGHRTERANVYRTETFSKVTGSGSDHALRCTCFREAAK
ncbi:hypothetical protein G5I_11587 [Acromyrmex echinatior]|uniref:Uncharacterized protein n=1 Tax=Acromyrmex echinatior TaxID=103372 RepID=F4X005_ACREC|nr:hypothetical protein G5I_11587 [Acromyrmex echinatior]